MASLAKEEMDALYDEAFAEGLASETAPVSIEQRCLEQACELREKIPDKLFFSSLAPNNSRFIRSAHQAQAFKDIADEALVGKKRKYEEDVDEYGRRLAAASRGLISMKTVLTSDTMHLMEAQADLFAMHLVAEQAKSQLLTAMLDCVSEQQEQVKVKVAECGKVLHPKIVVPARASVESVAALPVAHALPPLVISSAMEKPQEKVDEPWSATEIQLLMKLKDEKWGTWKEINKHFPTRTERSIRSRWSRVILERLAGKL